MLMVDGRLECSEEGQGFSETVKFELGVVAAMSLKDAISVFAGVVLMSGFGKIAPEEYCREILSKVG